MLLIKLGRSIKGQLNFMHQLNHSSAKSICIGCVYQGYVLSKIPRTVSFVFTIAAEGKAVPSGCVSCLLLLEYFFIMKFPFDLFGFLVVMTIVDIFRELYCKGVTFTGIWDSWLN